MDKHLLYFRLPQNQVINAWSLATPEKIKYLPKDRKGFILHPFDNNHTDPLFFPFTQVIESDLSFEKIILYEGRKCTIEQISEEKYSGIINEFKRQSSSDFQKVVLSRQIQIEKNPNYLPALFQKLLSNFPNAFIWILHSSKVGTFLGASPELLLKKDENSLHTVALAGTRSLNAPQFTEKEIEEQAFVQSYIESWINRYQLSFSKSETEPIRAGNSPFTNKI